MPTEFTLKTRIKTIPEVDSAELSETFKDYVDSLLKGQHTEEFNINALLDLTDSFGKEKPYPILNLSDAMPVLQNFRVRGMPDVRLLQRLLLKLNGPCQNAQASSLQRLELDVAKVTATTQADHEIKIQTLSRINNFLLDSKRFGSSSCLIMMETLADSSGFQLPSATINNELLLSQSPYLNDTPPKITNGNFYSKTLECILRIAEQRRDVVLPNPETVLPELLSRCDTATTIRCQQKLVKVATMLQVDKATLKTLQTQLGFAYLLAGKNELAEGALRQSCDEISSTSMVSLVLLAECLSREGKIFESDLVTERLNAPAKWAAEQNSDIYRSFGQAIHANNLKAVGQFESALKIFQDVEPIFARNTAFNYLLELKFPQSQKIFPTLHMVLSEQIALLQILGRLPQCAQKQKTLEASDLAAGKALAEYLEMELVNMPRFDYTDEQRLIYAKEYVDLCNSYLETVDERTAKILAYAIELRRNGALSAADFCLDCCNNKKSEAVQRIQNERVAVAEGRGDLITARRLLEKIPANDSDQETALRTSELWCTLYLINGEYNKCESQSRSLEKTLLSLDDSILKGPYNQSAQDEFLSKHRIGILDRAQALANLNRFEEALVLLRRLLKNGSSDDGDSIDTYALMAHCYQQSKHLGLAVVAEQHAIDAFRNGIDKPRESRLLADAKFQLARSFTAQGQTLRAQRYYSEALALIQQANLTGSALHRDIASALRSP